MSDNETKEDAIVKEVAETLVKSQYTNKRIDFDEVAMRRVKTMLPMYEEESGATSANELLSFVVRKAIDSLFENDFKTKINEI